MRRLYERLKMLTLVMTACLIFSGLSLPVRAYIQKSGTMNEAAVLRQNADSSSGQVMELSSGQEVTVNNELTDAGGTLWYQIFVNGSTMGYVPASVVTVSDTGSSASGDTSQGSSSGTSGQTTTVVERIGTITTTGSVNVRSEASTNGAIVGTLASGATFTIIETVSAGDGYDWHRLDLNGTAGYVRSDLASVEEVTHTVEVPETTDPTQSATESSPYSIISQLNAEGTTVWYLMDNTTGQTSAIDSLLNPVEDSKSGGNAGYMFAIVIELILLIVAGASAVFLYFKWQDAEDFIEEMHERQKNARRQGQGMATTNTVMTKQPTASRNAPPKKPLNASPTGGAKTPQTAGGMKTTQPTGSAKATQSAGRTGGGSYETRKPEQGTLGKTAAPAKKASSSPVYTPASAKAKAAAETVSRTIEASKAKAAAAGQAENAGSGIQTGSSPASNKGRTDDNFPKTSDILKTTRQELNNNEAAKTKPTSGTWKSKDFLSADDDDLEFDFLSVDDN